MSYSTMVPIFFIKRCVVYTYQGSKTKFDLKELVFCDICRSHYCSYQKEDKYTFPLDTIYKEMLYDNPLVIS